MKKFASSKLMTNLPSIFSSMTTHDPSMEDTLLHLVLAVMGGTDLETLIPLLLHLLQIKSDATAECVLISLTSIVKAGGALLFF